MRECSLLSLVSLAQSGELEGLCLKNVTDTTSLHITLPTPMCLPALVVTGAPAAQDVRVCNPWGADRDGGEARAAGSQRRRPQVRHVEICPSFTQVPLGVPARPGEGAGLSAALSEWPEGVRCQATWFMDVLALACPGCVIRGRSLDL